jgi:BirA family biotin operon repressor/biotin-[acetyl-CoA-carboxylase] ligase
LTVSPIIWRVEHFDEIDSTNTYVKEHADAEPEGLVVLADFQRAGRGRLDRAWSSPPRASLLCSVLLRPDLEAEQLQLVVAAVALATRAALERLSGLRAELKWPNDLVVGPKKLAGVLAELVSPSSGVAVVVGFGVNLTYEGPEGVAATSVRSETGLTIAPRALLDIVLEELEPRRAALDSDEGRSELRANYERALVTLGSIVRVEQHGGELVGAAVGLDHRGQLLVDVEGDVRVIEVGDVVHLRPGDAT